MQIIIDERMLPTSSLCTRQSSACSVQVTLDLNIDDRETDEYTDSASSNAIEGDKIGSKQSERERERKDLLVLSCVLNEFRCA